MRLTFCRPEFDAATYYSHEWCGHKIEEAEEKDHSVRDLPRSDANRSDFEENMRNFNPHAFIFYDHGDEDCLVAQGGMGCVVNSGNAYYLKGRLVYTMACLSAKRLGETVHEEGGLTYWGHDDVVGFVTTALQAFEESLSIGLSQLLEDRTVKQALEKTGETYEEWITHYTEGDGKDEEDAPIIAAYLEHDYEHTRVIGELNITLSQIPEPPIPEPTPIPCPFRRAAVKIFGSAGYKIPRKYGISLLLFAGGLIGYTHDRISEWATLGYRLHSMDAGVAALAVAFITVSFDFIKWLQRKYG